MEGTHEESLGERGRNLLPSWFTARMMDDVWQFGLLMVTGHVVGIQSINSIRQDHAGQLWLDVLLLPPDQVQFQKELARDCEMKIIVPTSTERLTASINASHVVFAFELGDS